MVSRARPREAKFSQVLVDDGSPQLVLLSTPGTSKIVAVAVNEPGFVEPYFGAEVSREQFLDFLNERFDLRFMFRRPAFRDWYLIDLSTIVDGNVQLHRRKLTKENARKFLPGPGIFARELTEEISEPIAPELAKQKFTVDGSWDLDEFSIFYGHYADLYALFNSVDLFLDEQEDLDRRRKVSEAFVKPWQGGGSYGSFYSSLLKAQSREDRLHVDAIQYASPGYVDIRGKSHPFEQTKDLILKFSENQKEIEDGYKHLYKFLSNLKLLTLKPDRFSKTGHIAEQVTVEAQKFAATLGASSYEDLLRMAGGDQLIVAKVLLATERRLRKIYEFFLQGRAEFSPSE